ncbi:AraC family transcriptional regulator [Sphingosinicella sp. BN140058]|uniref:helix-turn-helix transcriptional regulator n=1 Tax=Sphingosinicella sp. BN140058 TaxID=1892855 RepID=UPI0013ECEFF7|nr:AraC family transcriptional regulator [Sphingosinicella sp. BN140058]
MPSLVRFSTSSLPAADRVAYFQDMLARTLTGCNSSSLEQADLSVDVNFLTGQDVCLGITRSTSLRNHRDRSCLSDQDDDFLLLSVLSGTGRIEHREQRVTLQRGSGVLTRLSDTIDTHWPDARLMVLRLRRPALRNVDADRAAGLDLARSRPLMHLLHAYGRAVMRDALNGEPIDPLAERHMTELVEALCARSVDEAEQAARPAIGAARVAAMRETIARDHARPMLSMRDVAAAVGISERAGHLAFEAAELGFTEELHAVRLDRACERLAAGGERVIDVAFAVGFSDSSHFHRLFKRRFGMTPSEYRSAHRSRR